LNKIGFFAATAGMELNIKKNVLRANEHF
jgi:hypothetical protein